VLLPLVASAVGIRAGAVTFVDAAHDHWPAVHHGMEKLRLAIVESSQMLPQGTDVGYGLRRRFGIHVLYIIFIIHKYQHPGTQGLKAVLCH